MLLLAALARLEALAGLVATATGAYNLSVQIVKPAAAATAKSVRQGASMMVPVRITNMGSTTLFNVALKVELPEGLVPVGASKVLGSRRTTEGTNVYYTSLTLGPRKTKMLRVKAKAVGCEVGSLQVGALAYIQEPHYGAITCLTPASPPLVVSKGKRRGGS
jgi:hypothetical protein